MTRCGNFVRTAANKEAWLADAVLCPDCGAAAAGWVRGSDLYPRMKVRGHDAPDGVTPAPYAVHERGVLPAGGSP